MTSPDRLVIRERIYPGHHDALVEVLGRYPRQAGNQVVLAMTEACLRQWPFTEADLNVPDGAEFQQVKFTLSKSKYPLLFALHKALPRGVKGQAIMNLLNRHQMMRQADPGRVSDALNAAMLGQRPNASGNSPERAGQEHATDEPTSAFKLARSSALPVIEEPLPAVVNAADQRLQEVAPPPAEEVISDPLADLPPLDFG